MSRSQMSLAVLVVVALVVALEEWRIAGWRGRANKAEQELELALADQPPPPRPEEAGDHNSVVGASRIRRIKDRNEDRMAGEPKEGGVEPVVAEGTTEPVEALTNEPAGGAEPVDYRASANEMYSALVDSYKLNETERAYFIQLMAEGMKFQDEQAVALAAADGPDEQAAVVGKLAEAERVFGKRVRHFLGNDRDFEIYQAYVQKLAEQMAVGSGGGR